MSRSKEKMPKELREHWSRMLFHEALRELFDYYEMQEVRLPENVGLHTIYWRHKPEQPKPLIIEPVVKESDLDD